MGMGVFSSRKNQKVPGAHKIGAAISFPRIASGNFMDITLFHGICFSILLCSSQTFWELFVICSCSSGAFQSCFRISPLGEGSHGRNLSVLTKLGACMSSFFSGRTVVL